MDVKQRILVATLEVIKNHGMRGVRHRAVAAQAQVSLGSTTYHFKSIEDLISSTFVYWHGKIDLGKNPYFITIEEDVKQFTEVEMTPISLANLLYQDGERYLRNQIFDNSDDRRIELAFHNEALRNPQLSALLKRSWQQEVDRICHLYQSIGTDFPAEDAEITFALVLQFEKKAMLIEDTDELEIEFTKMKKVLKRYIYLVAGANSKNENHIH
ncbi:MAG: TetR family transcriptional regulator [Colwellia sp.]|nr:TetR family transcriptional regulator [Colwellia sp.]